MSDRSEKDNDDLIKELNKRVLALDSKKRSSDHDTVRYTIDALAEITKIDTPEIEKIAEEIIAEQGQRLADKQRAKKLAVTHGRELLAYLIAGTLAAIALFALIALWHGTQEAKEPLFTAESSAGGEPRLATNRHLYIRSKLGDALTRLSALKVSVTEYYAAVGRLPTTMAETGFDFREFEKLDGIEKVFLTQEGGIGASLSAEFGDEKWLVLQPTVSSGGAFINWVCNTNIEQKYLGPPKAAICVNNPNISSSPR